MGLVVTITDALQSVPSSAELKFLATGFLFAAALSLEGEDFLLDFLFFGGGAILDVYGEATDRGPDVDLCLCNGNY
jgi:hypothetical protein